MQDSVCGVLGHKPESVPVTLSGHFKPEGGHWDYHSVTVDGVRCSRCKVLLECPPLILDIPNSQQDATLIDGVQVITDEKDIKL